jgi:Leucine-rich repeat (LRR) protein
LFSFAVGVAGVMAGGWFGASPAQADTAVVPDDSFRSCLNSYLRQPAEAEVTSAQLSGLTGTVTCDGAERPSQVSDLTGSQYLTGLTSLALDHNQITDLSGLAGLSGLTNLELLGNQVDSTQALAGLTQLTSLDLRGNQITDLSGLAQATALTQLYADDNQLTDLTPLATATGLTTLWLSHNQIVDVTPLAGLTHLTELSLADNQLASVAPLAGLTSLQTVYLSDNHLTDLSPLPATLPAESCNGSVCTPHIFAAHQSATWSTAPGTAKPPIVQWSGSQQSLTLTIDSGDARLAQTVGDVVLNSPGDDQLSWQTSGADYFSGQLAVTVSGAPPGYDDTVATMVDDQAPGGNALPGTGPAASLGQLLAALLCFVLGLSAIAFGLWLPAATADRQAGL